MKTEKRLMGKVAIITGAARGIGKETALLFAKEGAKVVVADVHSSLGEEVVAKIQADGGQATFVLAHVEKAIDCQHLIAATIDHFGQLHILFNNAGIMHPQDGDIVDIDEKIWRQTFDINLNSIFWCCKYAIPALLQFGGGVIINAASFVALRGSACSKMAYAASKGAILSLSRDLAAKYAVNNIRVNALCPGPTATEAFTKAINIDPVKKRRYLEQVPQKRFAFPLEIAQAALFLASDESSFMTGAELVIDGGITSTYLARASYE